MNKPSSNFRVLAPTALFGRVRVSKGDLVRRELLGTNVRKLIEDGVVEPQLLTTPPKQIRVTLM